MDFDNLRTQLLKEIEPFRPLWSSPLIPNLHKVEKLVPETWLAVFDHSNPENITSEFWDGPKNIWPKDFQSFYEFCRNPISSIKAGICKSDHRVRQGISEKKSHEIHQLGRLIKNLRPGRKGLDLAGGQGHLAKELSDLGFRIESIDIDRHLQKMGKKLYYNDNVNFSCYNLVDLPRTLHFQQTDFVIGLHTCGSLADQVIQQGINAGTKCIISIGCCYEKLGGFQGIHEDPIGISGAFLASRYHPKPTNTPLASAYRFALDLLLREIGEPIGKLGRPSRQMLEQDFGSYALQSLKNVDRDIFMSREELNEFYSNTKHQTSIKRMVTANLIRILMGRPIEVAILLNRASRLSDNGYHVEIKEVFSQSISPRNLAIFARKAPS